MSFTYTLWHSDNQVLILIKPQTKIAKLTLILEFDLICLFPSVKAYRKYIENTLMMEAKWAVTKTVIRDAEPGLAEVKNYFTCIENKKIITQSQWG